MTKKNPWEMPPICLPYLGETRDAPAPVNCLKCGKNQNAATGLTNRHVPKPGDAAICFNCGHIMIYNDELKFREVTIEERTRIKSRKDVQILLDFVAQRKRKSPWS